MKIFNTKVHGVLDYLVGATLIALPAILNWNAPERTLVMTLGWITIGMSLLTAYEYSLFKVIPMAMHLFLDVCSALVLISAPFLMTGIGPAATNIMLALGVAELIAVALSQTTPTRDYFDRPMTPRGAPHIP